MEETNKQQEVKKPSYEELNNYCNQLMIQNRQLSQKLNQVMEIHTKLPFLFEALKNKEIFGEEFVNACAKEIKEIMMPHDYTEEEPEEEDTLEEVKEEPKTEE